MKKATLRKTMTFLTVITISLMLCIGGMLSLSASASGVYNGFVYTVKADDTVEITGYEGNDTAIVIPDTIDGKTVTSIGDDAFKANTSILSVKISDNVKSIGVHAFQNCTALASIDLGEGVEVVSEGSIEGLAITELVIPDSLQEIGLWAFSYNKQLTSVTIGKGVKTIKYNAFQECILLEEITIPSNVTYMEKEVFKNCHALEKIYVEGHPTLEDDTVFGGKSPVYHSSCGSICNHGASGAADEAHATEWQAWTSANSLPTAEGSYYLTQNVQVDSTANIRGGKINLCLNGYSISAKSSAVEYSIFSLTSRGTYGSAELSICDCQEVQGKITGGKATKGGAVYSIGIFHLWGGEISGNSASNTGGAVYNDGVFNMHGGKICNNTSAEAGGGVFNTDEFNMYGGEITGNTSTNSTGGGVFGSEGKIIRLSGTIKISGNKGAKGTNDLHLQTNATITVDEVLPGSSVGIYVDDGYTGDFSTGGAASVKCFNGGENNHVMANGENLYLGVHAFVPDYWTDTHHYNVCVCGDIKEYPHVKENIIDNRYVCSEGGYYKSCECGYRYTAETFDTFSHLACGAQSCTHEPSHGIITFAEWDIIDRMPALSGNYKLTVDVTIEDKWIVSADTVLCLNGHNLETKMNRVIEVPAGVTLTLCDCTGKNGKITGGYEYSYGGGVLVQGTLNMYGGNVYDNISMNGNDHGGGGVAIYGGTFNMYGGEIYDNYATFGGGVYLISGTANIYGGKIYDNIAYGGHGGGIRAHTGDLNIYSGEISGNQAYYAGGIMIGGATVNIYGGKIINNTSYEGGAAIGTWSSFKILGGEISGNHAQGSNYDGIYIGSGITITLGGDVKIFDNGTGNPDEGLEFNLFVDTQSQLIVGELAPTAKIGVATRTSRTTALTQGGAAYINNFVSDIEEMTVMADGENLIIHEHVVDFAALSATSHQGVCSVCNQTLTWKHEAGKVTDEKHLKSDGEGDEPDIYYMACTVCDYTMPNEGEFAVYFHPICGKECSHDTKHENIAFAEWKNESAMPSQNGNFKLICDVTLTETWHITGEVTLCLNGHKLTIKDSASRVVSVGANAKLTICDCKADTGEISGGYSSAGGGIYVSGTLDMYGGKICGNISSDMGGGVYVDGTFNMYGGKICDNKSTEVGGGVLNDGKFNMYGGEISGNSSKNSTGGGLFVFSQKTVSFEGAPIIFGNTGNKGTNNINLQNKAVINVGTMEDGARIGISLDNDYEGAITVGGAAYEMLFWSDSTDFETVPDGTNLKFAAHSTHTWENTFSIDGSVHYYSCTRCSARNEETEHTLDKSVEGDNYLKERTCTEKIYYKSCECGYSNETAETFSAKAEAIHDFGGEYLKDEDGHWHKCENCDVTEEKNAHSFGDGTVCTCGYEKQGEPDKTPEEPDKTPEEPDKTPEEPDKTPEEPDKTPEEPGKTPEEPDKNPEEPDKNPDSSDENPSTGEKDPDETDEKSDGGDNDGEQDKGDDKSDKKDNGKSDGKEDNEAVGCKSDGCDSLVSGTAVVIASVMGLAIGCVRKKRED